MNFLAHVLLAEPSPDSIVGNVLGDFVKGTVDSFPSSFDKGVVKGIRQHRAIDAFTDSHPTFAAAKSLLSPARRRYAGIIVDIYYDYLIGQSYPAGLPDLRRFISESYEILRSHPATHNTHLAEVLPTMIRQDWLGSPLTHDGLRETFRRVSRRSDKLSGIEGSLGEFLENETAFQKLFDQFWPDLQAYSSSWLDSAS